MRQFKEIELSMHCYCVNSGIKPCSEFTIFDEENAIQEFIEYVNLYSNELKFIINKHHTGNYYEVYLYKHNHIKTVIENIPNRLDNPEFFHWYMGKLFGVADSEIENFINKLKE